LIGRRFHCRAGTSREELALSCAATGGAPGFPFAEWPEHNAELRLEAFSTCGVPLCGASPVAESFEQANDLVQHVFVVRCPRFRKTGPAGRLHGVTAPFTPLCQDQRAMDRPPAQSLTLGVEPLLEPGAVGKVTALEQVTPVQHERFDFPPMVEVLLEHFGIQAELLRGNCDLLVATDEHRVSGQALP
jgi:hypothetical protein